MSAPPTSFLPASVLAVAAMLPAVASAQTCPSLLGIDATGLTTSTLWDVDPNTGVASNPRTVSGGLNRAPHCIDFSPSGVLYGLSLGGSGSPASGQLFTINPINGATTLVANLSQPVYVEGDIAFDPTTGILYAVEGVGQLYTINTTTGVCTLVGTLPLDMNGGADYSGLGFDNTGQLYVWTQFGSALRKVNKANATVSSTVFMSPFPGGAVGDVVFDPGTNKCLLGGNPSGGILSAVDPATGVVSPIGTTAPMAGVWSLTFDPRDCARVANQGNGCTTRYASVYEHLSQPTQDLSGLKITGTTVGTNLIVTCGPGTGISVLPGVIPLTLGDDASVPVGTLGLWVGSNGWLAQGPGNTTAPVPNIATFLNQPSAWLCAWTDLDPSNTAGGGVYYDEPSFGVGRATWYGVFGKGTTDANYIQIVWDVVNRNWSIEYGAIPTTNPQWWLTGYSPAGPSADPGPTDLSTLGGSPLTLDLFDTLPLGLVSVGRPVQGATAVPFNATTTNIDPSAIMHIGIVGLVSPNLPLAGFGLLPDCYLHASLDVITGPHMFPIGTQTWTAINLPALPPSFSGFQFYLQGATFTSSGVGPTTRFSNGLKCTVGLF